MSDRYKQIVLEEAGSQKAVDAYHACIDASRKLCRLIDVHPSADVLQAAANFGDRVMRRWLRECK